VLRAVLFDVDFTLSRPGPELGAEGYRRQGARHGLTLDVTLYEQARLVALDDLQHHPELVHDEEIWVCFTEDIVRGMGGDGDAVRACAVAIVKEWERHENFFLYDDALPTMAALRRHGIAIGLVSNGQRDLVEFVEHHGLDVDIAVGSKAHGRIKPHPSIFERALDGLGVRPQEGVMVGDSPADDIAGARALGMRAILLDRDGIHAAGGDRITSLDELPGVLGLVGER
jgi:HAD superfamily hydrolase (TIGR01549 family)